MFKYVFNMSVLCFSLSSYAFAELPDLTDASGSVLIAAPTAVGGPTNQGIWFLDPVSKAFSLNLPALPADQVYEGWVVDGCTGEKISSGLFRATGGIDSDAAGRYAGGLALSFPPQPGSDFVKKPGDLTDGGHSIVVTVEPYPDTDPNPSGIAVLKAQIPSGASVGTNLELENIFVATQAQ